MIMILLSIAFGLNIVFLVMAGTKTLPRPEKRSHGHPMKEFGCIKVRAERRAGEILEATEKHPGGNPNLSHDVTGSPKLDDLGITRKQSSRWQAIASIPEVHHE